MARAKHGMSPLPIQCFKGPEVQAKIAEAVTYALYQGQAEIQNQKGRRFLFLMARNGRVQFFDKWGFEVTHMVETAMPKAPADTVTYFDWTSPKGSVYQTKLEAVANGEQRLTKTHHIKEF